ncbi:MAG: site-specific integrase [Bryobacteraceae bacterium]|nr:MAG: site-specific integrase [Bryobacteraceae bacterium]
MPKRSQKGSLTQRLINGRTVWYAQWWEHGSHRSKILGAVTDLTEEQAQQALAAIVSTLKTGSVTLESRFTTVAEYVERVYFRTMTASWKHSTAVTTKNRIRKTVVAQFGRRILSTITRQELQEWLLTYARTRSAAMVKHVRFDLRSIFAMAQSDGLISHNPAATLVVPRDARPAQPKPSLSEAQVMSLLSCLPLREHLAARLAIFEGLRPGEIFALKWEDISGASVRISRRIYHGKIDTPKNSRPRLAALSQGTLELLTAWHSDVGGWTEWIFSSERGTPLRQENYWARYMAPQLRSAGLEWATWQALRRTNATLMRKYGADPKVGADQRGHGIGVSIDVYTASDLEQKRAAVQMLDDALKAKERTRERSVG